MTFQKQWESILDTISGDAVLIAFLAASVATEEVYKQGSEEWYRAAVAAYGSMTRERLMEATC